jgi:hypothetical protein
VWSAAPCGAAKDPDFFVYRAVDVRRRWSCACLLVLFCRCVAPDHALCFVSVLSAYSLQASCVLRAWSWRPVGRSGGVGRALGWKTLGELRALSRRHATSLLLSQSFSRVRLASGLLAALACAQSPRGDGRQEGVVLGPDPRRQCFGLQHLSESFTFGLRYALVGHFAQPVACRAVPGA